MILDQGIGEVLLDNGNYLVSIFSEQCIIKHDNFESVKDLNGNWIEFKRNIVYGKEVEHSTSYMLFLDNLKYINSNETCFDIVYAFEYLKKDIKSISFSSKALTNFYNGRFQVDELKRDNILQKINDNLNKSNTFSIELSYGTFSFEFENNIQGFHEEKNTNNLFPFDFQTTLIIEKVDGTISISDISKLIKYFFDFNRFISLNRYTKIDSCFVEYESLDEYNRFEIEIYKDYAKTFKFEECFNISDFGDSITSFLEKNGTFLKHSDNMYPFENGKVYAFDIARVSGAFEKVFEKYISKSKEYIEEIESLKKELHYDEFSKLVHNFKKEYQLNNNDNFDIMYQNFTRFGTLKMKLEYVIKKFCFHLNYNYKEYSNVFYDPNNMSNRFKNARNDIDHGLEKDSTNWYGASKDVYFVEQLIYFIILKYALKVSDDKIKDALERIYRCYNYSFKKIK